MISQEVLRSGNTGKANPFTICIVANRLLEAPSGSGQFIKDPIITSPAAFDACASYIVSCLFGGLPNQTEGILNDSATASDVRIVSIFDAGVVDPNASDGDAQSLVAQDASSFLLIARRTQIKAYLQAVFGQVVDVAYAVSASDTHKRASAWYTTDDPANVGVPFQMDGVKYTHCFNSFIPGTVAIHVTADSLTATHEFGHALSSYQNGMIVDLYVDSSPGLNCKRKRPIPSGFCNYATVPFASDLTRANLSYPAGWQSYHCERNGAAPTGPDLPAIMDNYYIVPTGHMSQQCEHDIVTRRFLKDRLAAKIGRP